MTRTFEGDLGSRVRDISGLRRLVGDRVFPNQRTPGSSLPCVTFFRMARETLQRLNGPPVGTVKAMYLFECWGESSDQANRLLIELVKAWPDGIDGVLGQVWGDWFVQATTVRDARDEVEAPGH